MLTRRQPTSQMCRQPISPILFPSMLKGSDLDSYPLTPPRQPWRGACNPSRISHFYLLFPPIYTDIFIWGFPSWLYSETCSQSPPPCCHLLLGKCTKMDDFETPHIGLAKVAAAGCSDVVHFYLIRQVQRLRCRRAVQLWLQIVEISMLPILLFPTSSTQYAVRDRTPSPLDFLFPGGGWSRGVAGEYGRAWGWGGSRPVRLSGEGGTKVVGVERLSTPKLLFDNFLHCCYFYWLIIFRLFQSPSCKIKNCLYSLV